MTLSFFTPAPTALDTLSLPDALPISGVGELDTTCQCAGAVTVKENVAFRSGCSNTANIRRVSATSNCEYRYTSSSTGCTNRCSRSEEHTSELQSRFDLVCRLLLEKIT